MGVVEIPLRGRYGHGKVARVDECFAEAVRAHKWYFSNGYANAKIGGVTAYLHRYILALADIPIANRIDHVNQDKLDCRVQNLSSRPAGKSPGQIPNPHPISDDDRAKNLSVVVLDGSERLLRAFLTERQSQIELQADEPLWLATERIVKLTMEGLTKTRAAWWSSLGEWHVHPVSPTHPVLHVGPKPPRHPSIGDLWRDTSCLPHLVKQYHPLSTWRIVLDNISPGMPRRAVRSLLSTLLSDVEVSVRWPRLIPLNEDIEMMLANRIDGAERNGRPTYLACAIIAALLEVETKHVVDLLANYRRALTSA